MSQEAMPTTETISLCELERAVPSLYTSLPFTVTHEI